MTKAPILPGQYKSSKLAKKASISTGLCLSHPPRNPAMGSLGLSPPLHGCLLMKDPHASLLFIEEFVSCPVLQMENIGSGSVERFQTFREFFIFMCRMWRRVCHVTFSCTWASGENLNSYLSSLCPLSCVSDVVGGLWPGLAVTSNMEGTKIHWYICTDRSYLYHLYYKCTHTLCAALAFYITALPFLDVSISYRCWAHRFFPVTV